jgi:outer membrane receptor for ferrienterochelin and colicin
MKYRATGLMLAALGLWAGQGRADTAGAAGATPAPTAAPTAAAAASADDAFKFFLQEADVVTASRRAQKKSDSPVAIDVITHDEIEKSGAKSIEDLLRFRVGVNVQAGTSIEGNPSMVNVRGLPEELSSSLQVLVDGRSIVSVENSGIYWRRFPVPLDDIDRIEIVRGPNSALFGANAGQGVINIITKKPGAGGQARAELGTLGQKLGLVAVDDGSDGVGVRGSIESSSNSSSFDTFGNQPVDGNSTLGNLRLNARATGKPWDGGDLDFSVGHMKINYDYPEALGAGGVVNNENSYELLKLTQALNEDWTLEVTGSNRNDITVSTLDGGLEKDYSADALLRASLLDGKSQTVLGTSYLYSEDDFSGLFSDSTSSPSLYAYTSSPGETTRYQHEGRAYLSEQMALLDWLSVALAGSFESSDTGGEEPAYQGALIFKPVDDASLRLSASHSPTMPSLLNKYGRIELVSGFDQSTGTETVIRVEGTDMTPPQVASYEATLSWALFERRVNFEVTGYQMEIEGYPEFAQGPTISFPFTPPSTPGKVGSVSYYENTDNLVMRGTETTLTFKPTLGTQIQLNHTYEDVQAANYTQEYYYTTPWNMVNLMGSTDLPFGFNFSGGLSWQGQHYVDLQSKESTIFVPDQAKVDLRLGWSPVKDVEIYALGANLDHAFRTESPDGLTVDQSYSGGINIAFGGSQK